MAFSSEDERNAIAQAHEDAIEIADQVRNLADAVRAVGFRIGHEITMLHSPPSRWQQFAQAWRGRREQRREQREQRRRWFRYQRARFFRWMENADANDEIVEYLESAE